jgi:putative ABC transport system substrate-binding protein
MQRFAKALVALQPDLILSHNTPTTATLLQQTRTIPIVFAVVSDPIGTGFAQSFSRPGGNVTGFTNIEPTMASKWLELLKEIAPRVARVAFLFNPATAPYAEYYLSPFKVAAASLALEAIPTPVRNTSELESAMAAQARTPNGGLVLMTDSFLVTHRAKITSLAARYRLPVVYPFRDFIELGGLLSYGNDLYDNFRRGATYADRILKGATPNELPVQAPVKFELSINLRTAKALGLTIPQSILVRADQVTASQTASPLWETSERFLAEPSPCMRPLLLGNGHRPLNAMTTLSWSLDGRRKKRSSKDWANVSDPDVKIVR